MKDDRYVRDSGERSLPLCDRLQDASYPAYLEMIFDLPRPSRVQDPMLVLRAQLDALFSPCEINATARVYRTEAIIIDGMGHDMTLEPDRANPARVFVGFHRWRESTCPLTYRPSR